MVGAGMKVKVPVLVAVPPGVVTVIVAGGAVAHRRADGGRSW